MAEERSEAEGDRKKERKPERVQEGKCILLIVMNINEVFNAYKVSINYLD